jgi:hypothetical protein
MLKSLMARVANLSSDALLDRDGSFGAWAEVGAVIDGLQSPLGAGFGAAVTADGR